MLLQFLPSYFCDPSFSTIANIKIENIINIKEEMRKEISYIRSNITEIHENRRAQVWNQD